MVTDLLLPPWLAPVAAAARALLGWLKAFRVTVNGVVLASLLACMLGGGWWIARTARANERARIHEAREQATNDVNADIGALIRLRRGEIAASHASLASISADLKRMVAEIPDRVVTETTYVPLTVPLPTPVAVGVPAPRRAAVAAPSPGPCDYPEEIRATLSRINVGGVK